MRKYKIVKTTDVGSERIYTVGLWGAMQVIRHSFVFDRIQINLIEKESRSWKKPSSRWVNHRKSYVGKSKRFLIRLSNVGNTRKKSTGSKKRG